jgi:hypothetical protein
MYFLIKNNNVKLFMGKLSLAAISRYYFFYFKQTLCFCVLVSCAESLRFSMHLTSVTVKDKIITL